MILSFELERARRDIAPKSPFQSDLERDIAIVALREPRLLAVYADLFRIAADQIRLTGRVNMKPDLQGEDII